MALLLSCLPRAPDIDRPGSAFFMGGGLGVFVGVFDEMSVLMWCFDGQFVVFCMAYVVV
jgi:hypothetical protein